MNRVIKRLMCITELINSITELINSEESYQPEYRDSLIRAFIVHLEENYDCILNCKTTHQNLLRHLFVLHSERTL